MKRIIALMLLCSFFVVGCTGGQPSTGENTEPGETEVTEEVVIGSGDYELIVVGGEPEGVAAAVSAARNGVKTLLVEDGTALGGLMTLGKLNFIDYAHGRDGVLLTQGIFEEFHDRVGGTAFDVEEAKAVFLDMVEKEENITLKLNTPFVEPVMEGNTVVGVVLEENEENVQYNCKRVIDATVDADVAAAAGAPYTFAGEDIGEKDRQMGVTLVFELSGVNWNKVVKYLKKDNDPHTGADKKTAWGYTEDGYSYEPTDDMMRLRGFNAAKQKNGNVLINALIIFGVDVLDPVSREEGIERAEKELNHLLPYIRENFVGFENAELVGVAEELYVRESRHIIGEYQLTIDDVLENKDFWDKIAIASYPVDVQPTANQRYGTVIGSPDRYGVPFRSLVPLEVENLLVVGRSASFTSLAAGSARVVPIGMASGEGAGVAVAYSINHDMNFREMSRSAEAIGQVQDDLRKQGAYLKDFNIVEPITKHWAYEGVKVIRGLGILDGGYSNDYRLEQEITAGRFENLVNKSMRKAGLNIPDVYVSKDLRNGEILLKVAQIVDPSVSGVDGARVVLQEKGILTEQLKPYFADDQKKPQAAEVIVLVANLYNAVTHN